VQVAALASPADMVREGYDLDPEMVDWAIAGLRQMRPETEIGFEVAAFIGKLADRPGPPLGSRNAAKDKTAFNSGNARVISLGRRNDAAYIVARLERDAPELVAPGGWVGRVM
jgi:hypothetical protein